MRRRAALCAAGSLPHERFLAASGLAKHFQSVGVWRYGENSFARLLHDAQSYVRNKHVRSANFGQKSLHFGVLIRVQLG